jgi:hypothetical protein
VGFGRKAVAVVGGEDAPGGGAGEMGTEHKGIRRGSIREESASSRAGRVGIVVSARRPLRMAELDRVVHDVTGDHAAVANSHTHMPRGVPGRCPEFDIASEGRVRWHRIDKPGVDHRLHRIGECGRVQGIVRLRPAVDIGSPEQVPRARERRGPFAVDQTRVPAHVIDVQVGVRDPPGRPCGVSRRA